MGVRGYEATADGSDFDEIWTEGIAKAQGRITDVGLYPEVSANYILFKVGSTYYRRDGSSGIVDDSNANASTLIQATLDDLTVGREWYEKIDLKGTFHVDTKIELPNWCWINGGVLTFDTAFADVVLENSIRTGTDANVGVMLTNLRIEGEDPVNQQNAAARGLDWYAEYSPAGCDPDPNFGTDSDANLFRQNLVMKNVIFHRIRGDMCRIEQSAYADVSIVNLDHVYFNGSWDKGLKVTKIMESTFRSLFFEYMAGDYPIYLDQGLELDFSDIMVNDWSEDENAAVYLNSCNWVRFTGGQIGGGPGQTNGLYINGGKANSWNGGDIGDCGVFADDTYSAVVLNNTTYNRIIGAYLGEKPGTARANDMEYGVEELGSSDFNIISACIAYEYATAGYKIIGANSDVSHSIGTVV